MIPALAPADGFRALTLHDVVPAGHIAVPVLHDRRSPHISAGKFAVLERRSVLAGLAALPAAGLPLAAMAARAHPEPIVAVLAHARALHDQAERDGISDERSDAAFDEVAKLRDTAAEMPVVTMAGAVAVLAWARAEFASCYVDRADPDHLDRVTLRFIDGALGVMRAAVEGGRA